MVTKNGPRNVETNVRLGDPEAINLMALLKSDPVEVFTSLTCGLPESVEFEKLASVAKYLVPNGYPEKSERGEPVLVDSGALHDAGLQFILANGDPVTGDGRLTPTGSRFAALLALRPELAMAEEAVEGMLEHLALPGLRHRSDIAKPDSLQAKIQRMQKLLQ